MNLTRVDITPTQLEEWSKTKAKLQFSQPAFTHILYRMLNPDQDDNIALWTRDLPTMATDGKRLIVNPDFFFALDLFERVFTVCHEIAHDMFLHCPTMQAHVRTGNPVIWAGKPLPYNQELANIAMDFVINAMLVDANVGRMPKNSGCYDKQYTADMAWQEVYHKLWQSCAKGPKGNGSSEGDGKGDLTGKGLGLSEQRFDQHLPPGASSDQNPDSSEAQPNEQLWQQAILGAMAVARSAGKLPAALEKKLEEFLKPKVKWTDHIETLFARNIGRSAYDYRRLDRRLVVREIGAPGRSGHGAGTIVVGMDSSGSIYAVKSLIERFFGELSGIMEELRPKRLIVVWCDAKVQRVDDMEDEGDLRSSYYKGAKGGGGTSFVPVFDWIHEEDVGPIDALVYLTDGDGAFPDSAPTYPVIWGDISHDPKKYPFGAVVEIPNDGTA